LAEALARSYFPHLHPYDPKVQAMAHALDEHRHYQIRHSLHEIAAQIFKKK